MRDALTDRVDTIARAAPTAAEARERERQRNRELYPGIAEWHAMLTDVFGPGCRVTWATNGKQQVGQALAQKWRVVALSPPQPKPKEGKRGG